MDFDYDDEYKQSFRLQTGGTIGASEENVDKKHAGLFISLGMFVLFLCAWFKVAGLVQLIAVWLALSLFLGPFAPVSLTAGDCRVGQGEILPLLVQVPPTRDTVQVDRRSLRSRKHAKDYKAVEVECVEPEDVKKREEERVKPEKLGIVENGKPKADGKWSEEEIAMLKKQIAKYPRGTARRWQVIAESFNGSRTVDEVIEMAKGFGKKPGDEDAYAKFLAQRKVSNKQISSDASLRKEFQGDDVAIAVANGNGTGNVELPGATAWSEAEDKELLSALKKFPKDTPMRWEKVGEAVAGRTKSQCMKRFVELRDGFRSLKNVAD